MLSWGKIYSISYLLVLFIVLFSNTSLAQNAGVDEQYNNKLNEAEKFYFEKNYTEAKKAFNVALSIKPAENHPQTRIKEINKILGIQEDSPNNFTGIVAEADRLYDAKKLEDALEKYKEANALNPDDERVTERILELHSLIRKNTNLSAEYNRLIENANAYFDSGKLDKAREAYGEALALKPTESYPAQKIAEINAKTEVKKQYETAVELADQLYIEKKYEDAKKAYADAQTIKPDEDYPGSMIGRIEDLYKEIDQNYLLYVEKGDNYFDTEKLELALEAYEKAGALKPDEAYPGSMISMITGMMEGEAERNERYNVLLTNGDDFLVELNYIEAQMAFEQASSLKPGEVYPKEKLVEIGAVLDKLYAEEEEFQTIISQADDFFDEEEYPSAAEEYQKALEFRPEDSYALSRISEIKTIEKSLADVQVSYDAAIASADAFFQIENYESAKAEYQKAATLKSEETYPQTKLAEITTLLAGIAEVDASYDAAIASADQFFQTENYESAKAEYQKAATLKPKETYPQTKLTEISSLLAGIAETNTAYDAAITSADEFFQTGNYASAKAEYEKAATLKPEETYPQTRLSEITTLLAGIAETNTAYDAAITSADEFFQTGNYASAKAEYEKAATLKPEETYPQTRLSEITTLLAGIAEVDASYDAAIASADQFFQTGNYESAKTEYEKAATLKPEETYPQTKLTEITSLLAGIAEKNTAYNAAIASADQFFQTGNYESAKTEYEKAATLKPGETYPQTKLTEITSLLAGIAETNTAYDAAIASADEFFQTGNYESAKTEYKKAATLKPEETYPQTRLTEITSLFAGIAETNTAYDAAIASADQFFQTGNYESAKTEYEKATTLKPEESYPQTRLTEITSLLAGIAETNTAYDAAITSADQFFQIENYESAKAEYEKAATLKPEETYPQSKLTEITTLLARIAEINTAYDAAISTADQFFQTENYKSAKAEYEKAATLKPEETYPQTKLTEITNLLAEIAEADAAYDAAIASADQFFQTGNYESAKAEYEKAATLKPEETYPQTRLTEITSLFAGIAETNTAYDAAIASADQFFQTGNYESAKTEYEKASTLKPGETYPQTKLTEITSLLAGIAETNTAYDAAIASADQFFQTGNYESANAEYEKAATLKPEETYPQTRLTEITSLLAGIAETNTAYDAAITSADQFFQIENYESAKAEYEKAATLKPEETYPQTRLTEITSLFAGIAETNTAYDAAIASADQFFQIENYESAKTEYEKAATLKPEETYPQSKLAEIATLLAGIAETNTAYDTAIASADEFFQTGNYESAKAEYQKAASLKPEETYPQTRLTEITSLLAGIAETNTAYDAAIASADQFFQTGNYESAKEEYEKASTLKPGETYPQSKLAEIATLLAGIAETNTAYDAAIASADQFFQTGNYESAKAEYEKAATLKPEETYPQTRLTEITSLFAGIAETNTAYDAAIASADQFFQIENYESAKTEYEKAATLKPEETYPQSKLAEIATLLAGIAETNTAYDAAIASADEFFQTGNYESAKAEYQKASTLKPEETYPQTKLSEIATLLAGIAEINTAYDAAIFSADQFFQTGNYESAKAEYEKAATLKPEETYPQSKLAEIATLLAGIAETNTAYDAAIASADQFFQTGNYASAKTEYQKAATLKPEETYPQTRLSEITTLLVGIAETNTAYDAAITSADEFFQTGNYESAKAEYEKAASLKPEESYPKDRLIEVEKQIKGLAAELARKQKQYDNLVGSADFQLAAKNYQKAKSSYKDARVLFPENPYPGQKISEIDEILAAEYEKARQEYNRLIKEADRYLEQKVYDNAIQYYMSADAVLPEEAYPNDKIKEIRKIIEDNVVVDIIKSNQVLENNVLTQFDFEPVPRIGRKESYIVVKARNLEEKDFRLFLNYGKGGQKNGGFVINIPIDNYTRDYIVKVGGQYKWFSEDNNWISLQPEGGSVEVSFIQISQE